MPRSSSQSRHTPSAPRPAAPKPATTVSSSFGQAVKEGLGVGLGVSLGYRLVTSIFGASRVEVVDTKLPAAPAAPYVPSSQAPVDLPQFTPYQKCIESHPNDPMYCDSLKHNDDE